MPAAAGPPPVHVLHTFHRRRASPVAPTLNRPVLFLLPFLFLLPARAQGPLAQPSVSGGLRGVYALSEVAEDLGGLPFRRGAASAGKLQDAERVRLQLAIQSAPNPVEKSLLEGAAELNEEARLQSQSAFTQMLRLGTTLEQSMGAQERVESCELLACGEHGYCAEVQGRASCRCLEGYEGNGFVCRTPAQPTEHSLFQAPPTALGPHVADLHVSTLRNNYVALVYRDTARSNWGYLMFGQAGPDRVAWKTPILFSNKSEAFGPMLVELQDGSGIAIAFRDADRGGSGILLAGSHDPSQNTVQFGAPRAFARHQAQNMGLVALPKSLVALVFAEHTPDKITGKLETGAMYGSAVLAKVRADGGLPELVSKRRFTSGPTARISAVMLSPESFLVAFRQAEDTSGGEKAEASCALARLRRGELIFEPRALSLEPSAPHIWARSMAVVGEGLVSYTYHSGREQLTKEALLQVDPVTHQLSLLRGPMVIGKGFTPYVSSVGTFTPLQQHQTAAQLRRLQSQGSRMVTYFRGAGAVKPKARFCKVEAGGLPDKCQDLLWASHDVRSVSGTQIGDGRFLFVSSDARNIGYYQLIGVMDPL